MTLIAHISDPHFGTEEAAVCAALREDLQRISPALVVLSGDITQRARTAQFLAARNFIERLAPLPVLAVPGNHDLPLFNLFSRFLRPYAGYRRHICPELAPAWLTPEVAVLAVNSTRPRRHKNGELPPALIARIAERLNALPQPFKAVVLHHPLLAADPHDLRNIARGALPALAAWSNAGADIFLGGHIHLAYCVPADGPHRRSIVAQAGTAVSWRRRSGHPNSWNLLRFVAGEAKGIRVERRDFNSAEGRFEAGAAWEARLESRGWQLARH